MWPDYRSSISVPPFGMNLELKSEFEKKNGSSVVPLNLFYALSILAFDRKKDKHTLSVD